MEEYHLWRVTKIIIYHFLGISLSTWAVVFFCTRLGLVFLCTAQSFSLDLFDSNFHRLLNFGLKPADFKLFTSCLKHSYNTLSRCEFWIFDFLSWRLHGIHAWPVERLGTRSWSTRILFMLKLEIGDIMSSPSNLGSGSAPVDAAQEYYLNFVRNISLCLSRLLCR